MSCLCIWTNSMHQWCTFDLIAVWLTYNANWILYFRLAIVRTYYWPGADIQYLNIMTRRYSKTFCITASLCGECISYKALFYKVPVMRSFRELLVAFLITLLRRRRVGDDLASLNNGAIAMGGIAIAIQCTPTGYNLKLDVARFVTRAISNYVIMSIRVISNQWETENLRAACEYKVFLLFIKSQQEWYHQNAYQERLIYIYIYKYICEMGTWSPLCLWMSKYSARPSARTILNTMINFVCKFNIGNASYTYLQVYLYIYICICNAFPSLYVSCISDDVYITSHDELYMPNILLSERIVLELICNKVKYSQLSLLTQKRVALEYFYRGKFHIRQ